jgi:hypothetical protein
MHRRRPKSSLSTERLEQPQRSSERRPWLRHSEIPQQSSKDHRDPQRQQEGDRDGNAEWEMLADLGRDDDLQEMCSTQHAEPFERIGKGRRQADALRLEAVDEVVGERRSTKDDR